MTLAADPRQFPIARSLNRLLDHLLPRRCIACGGAGGECNLCPPCLRELPRIDIGCRKCGTSLSLPTDTVCGACLAREPPWHRGTAALEYRFPVDQLVCRFKFQRDLAAGEVLAQELRRAIGRCGLAPPDVIVPVPLHRRRHLTRSFNQAEVLARPLAEMLMVPIDPGLLKRIRNTPAQSNLDAPRRRKNLRGAFACRRIGGARVALVDDVLTTGATLAECARTLLRAGAAEVSVWVAARADDG